MENCLWQFSIILEGEAFRLTPHAGDVVWVCICDNISGQQKDVEDADRTDSRGRLSLQQTRFKLVKKFLGVLGGSFKKPPSTLLKFIKQHTYIYKNNYLKGSDTNGRKKPERI